ncbi:MAG: 4-phosphoerythronate dehydrogenase [Pseudomonadota bacterium]
MTELVLADESIPGLEGRLPPGVRVRTFAGGPLRPDELIGVDVLMVRSVTRVDSSLLADARVRFVGSATSGVDHIDQNYLNSEGIEFAHTPGANANAVVDYVLAAIAAVDDKLERVLGVGHVGIVGFGHIGRALAKRLSALGVSVHIYDPWLTPQQLTQAATFETVLSCDVVSLHTSLTDQHPWPSRHLIDTAQLQQIQKDSLLINASRGAVINNKALLARLTSQAPPAVVLDVWEGEPRLDPRLLPYLRFGTAHIAGYSLGAKLEATRRLVRAAWPDQAGSEAAFGDGHERYMQVSESVTGADLLRDVILHCCDIHGDDRQLRTALAGVQGEGVASAFVHERKHYPDRQELTGLKVEVRALSDVDRDRLTALGCITQDVAASPDA